MAFVKVSYKYQAIENEGDVEKEKTVHSACSGVLMLISEWKKKKEKLEKMDGFSFTEEPFVREKREVIDDV